jgi:hypothetical protein
LASLRIDPVAAAFKTFQQFKPFKRFKALTPSLSRKRERARERVSRRKAQRVMLRCSTLNNLDLVF